jgi:hypothetical protein
MEFGTSKQCHARAMLHEAHAHIVHKDAAAALNIVLRAVHLMHGPEACSAAAEKFRTGLVQRDSALDDLSVLVRNLSIYDSQSNDGMNCQGPLVSGTDSLLQGTEALQSQGQAPIVLENYSTMNTDTKQQLSALEAASYVCQQCGGVVASCRREQHLTHWCPALQTNQEL